MQMTDEQVWTDLARFAEAMKRAATVVFNDGSSRPTNTLDGKGMCFQTMANAKGVREIIEPPEKKVRPLNAEEWRGVEGCIIDPRNFAGFNFVPFQWSVDWNDFRKTAATAKATCHPPGFPADVRKLWAEE